MIQISKLATSPNKSTDKNLIQDERDRLVKRIGELQKVFQADKRFALLVIIQGMDAAGKDGLIADVFKECNPQYCSVYSFKKPTDYELAHDFLWRVHQQVPEKGMIRVFNRSHYEDILIQRVHHWVDEETIQKRMKQINDFEQMLTENGTYIVKIFLNVSYEEQGRRLQERIDNPQKSWKHNPGDWAEREKWAEYMNAYEDALNKCAAACEWTVVPSDKNWYKEYIAAQQIVEVLESMDLRYPKVETETGTK